MILDYDQPNFIRENDLTRRRRSRTRTRPATIMTCLLAMSSLIFLLGLFSRTHGSSTHAVASTHHSVNNERRTTEKEGHHHDDRQQSQQQQQQQQQPQRRTEVEILDGTRHFVHSTESEFDHMVTLVDIAGSSTLSLHWNDVVGNTVTCRLVHRAHSASTAAGWLGLGVYDTFTKDANPNPASELMVGSDAIIGLVSTGEAKKYHLGGKRIISSSSSDGVYPMKESQQTLFPSETKITQHLGDDGAVVTVLTFEKLLVESTQDEIDIRDVGTNVFIWAVGGRDVGGTGGLTFHVERGAVTLDFEQVKERAEKGEGGIDEEEDKLADSGGDSTTEEEEATEAGTGEEDAQGDTTKENGKEETKSTTEEEEESDAPVVSGKCESPDSDYLRMVQLTPTLDFHWNLNVATESTSRSDQPASVSIKLVYRGKGWIGIGFSHDGLMLGSEAVIGLPPSSDPPLKYHLLDKTTSGIKPMPESQQTLIDASVIQEGPTTTLTFTKLLSEKGEISLKESGMTTFLYAIGTSNNLAYHEHRGSFQLDLSTCTNTVSTQSTGSATTSSQDDGDNDEPQHMSAWAAHGTIATLAFGVAAPFAVATAWFRTLVPSSWIYIHVFANVATFFLALVAFIIAVVTMGMSDHPDHFSKAHHTVGLAMLVLVTFQVLNGFLRPPVERKDPYGRDDEEEGWIHLPRSPREIWHLFHRSTGICLIAMGLWQIQDGMGMFADEFNARSLVPFFWAYVGIFASVLIGLRIWIMWEEYKAQRGMETVGVGAIDGRKMGGAAKSSGIDHDSELVPVQMDMGMY